MNCGCAEVITPGLVDLFDARERMATAARPVAGGERVALEEAEGRVLGDAVAAALDLPGVDNSAMDGYALRLAELTPRGLPVIQRVPAGAGVMHLPEGGCARIFTGAPVPIGADAVVPQEKVRLDAEGRVHVEGGLSPGANIRRQGEESRAGTPLLASNTRLEAAAIALLASHGIAEVTVRRRVRVALLSTGDELIEPGQPRAPGQVFDSNRAMLKSLMAHQSIELIDIGVVLDDPHELQRALERARDEADLVVCSGGVSVGEEDHVRPAIERLGGIVFHGVGIKPGKPFALGFLGESLDAGTPLVALPGNPVASLVGWQFLALPLLQGCQGMTPPPLQRFPVKAGFSRRGPRGRRELLRVVIDWSSGTPVAQLAGGQGSHMLSAASQAHGYLLVDADTDVEEHHAYGYCPAAQFGR
ncbi:gephyrin-like molybdotransferase Glp [Halomonas icarae]|uniref:Molybdopterin molybdenumtransferase n=1 Tax=Halomonas icarae TaxID=2691040 RepID=A0A7X4VYA0_9GAMM|nr:gephyrin-like molybdotransferase Glp [Halomonas icarae]MDR5902877.1 molybdopterin molybdotransferase MoeA [Halomonas icarae]NAW12416.1 molybdopterin molybdenumtransferase MoeA [Halomonas icarae]